MIERGKTTREFLGVAFAILILASLLGSFLSILYPLQAQASPTPKMDIELGKMIDYYVEEKDEYGNYKYYREFWEISLSQYKAWIALITLLETINGRYAAHSTGNPGGDFFEHKTAGEGFAFSTGIGAFQLDRGGGEGGEDWSHMPTIEKIDPKFSLLSALRWHYNYFDDATKVFTLSDSSSVNKWHAVYYEGLSPDRKVDFRNTWEAITGHTWDECKDSKLDVHFNLANITISDPFTDSVSYIDKLKWDVDFITDTGKAFSCSDYFDTWLISARSWSGAQITQYYYTYDRNKECEVWAWNNRGQGNEFRYIFARDFTTGWLPEHVEGDRAGEDTLTDPALDRNDIKPDPISKGLTWLRKHRANLPWPSDWSWQNSVGITSMAALAFLNASYTEDDPLVEKAIQYILTNVKPDGSIYSYAVTYETSTAIWALVTADRTRTNEPDKYATQISNAKDWLVKSQWDEDCLWGSVNKDDWRYGGFGYGHSARPDLSNTQFALMALSAAGLAKNDLLWDKAQIFLTRCQNRQKDVTIANLNYTVKWDPSFNKYDDGGFVYLPGSSLAGDVNSYGSMTAAGVWSLRLCGVSAGNARVQAGLEWLRAREDGIFDDNPEMPDGGGQRFQFYYYMAVAKALAMCFVNELHPGEDWVEQLTKRLADLQAADGHWVNTYTGHGSEDVAEIATAFALLTLETQAPPPANLWMSMILASHADLHIYDPQGRHLGMNYQTGQMENEIPGATFATDAQGRQIVELPELEAGHYRIELVGTSDGEYSLTVTGYRDQDVISSETVNGTIGEEDTHVVDVVVSSLIGSLTIFVEEPEIVPTGLVAIPGDQFVTLSWTPYQVPGFDLAGYDVYRSTTSGIGYEKINSSLITTANYPDTGLMNGATYCYVITAVDALQNETSHSREASATPSIQVVGPPQAPGGQGPPNDGVDHPRAVVNGLFEDVDGNGVFDIDDAILLARLYAGLEAGGQTYLNNNVQYFDFNSDGVADIDDAIALSRIFAGLDIGPASVDSEIMVIPQGRYATTGSFKGSQYSLLLKDASKGLKVYKIVLSVDKGSISGVSLSNLVGIELEISSDKKRATIAAVDFAGTLQPGQDAQAYELARVWISGTDRLHVEAEIVQDDDGKPLPESWIYVKQTQPVSLRVDRLTVLPNPVTSTDTAYVAVQGEGIHSICLQVLDLSGRLVYDSGLVVGSTTAWHLVNQAGETLANGVYLYIVTVHGFDGAQEKLETGKLAILR